VINNFNFYLNFLKTKICKMSGKKKICMVSYYGSHVEPIASAVRYLNESTQVTVNADFPMLKWRGDANDKRKDYLDLAVDVFSQSDIVLFWYHSLTAIEMKYLRSKVPASTVFALFTWDDPYDWQSPFLNTKVTEKFYSIVFTCCKESLADYSAPLKRFLLPGFQLDVAEKTIAEHAGPDRFVCDVCMLCTNLYSDAQLYPNQQIVRKELIDAIYADKSLVFHIYGPESLRALYPDAYKGFIGLETTFTVMRTARVCLSTHVVSLPKNISYSNERTIIAMGTGALLITDLVPPGSCALQLGDSILKALENIKAAVRLPYEQSEPLRTQLHQFAKENYTWQHWAKTVAETCAIENTATYPWSEKPTITTSKRQMVDFLLGKPVSETDTIQEFGNHLTTFSRSRSESRDAAATDHGSEKKRFQTAVSIGSWCCSAHQLNNARVRSSSYPFDWIFSNLRAVIDSVDSVDLVVDEFQTPDHARSDYETGAHPVLGFPHHSPNSLTDLMRLRRASTRWNDLLHSTTRRHKALFLHTARPSEKIVPIVEHLIELDEKMRQSSTLEDWCIVSVWHRLADEIIVAQAAAESAISDGETADEPKDDQRQRRRLNSLKCAYWSQRIVIYIADVTREWDGDNWGATLQSELWQQINELHSVTKQPACKDNI
jgi:hypothetical protein